MNLFQIFADNRNPNSKSSELRKKRFQLFINLLDINSNNKILDVGGTEAIWIDTGLEKNVTLLNINHPFDKKEKFTYVEGDACNMQMFSNEEFDVVF